MSRYINVQSFALQSSRGKLCPIPLIRVGGLSWLSSMSLLHFPPGSRVCARFEHKLRNLMAAGKCLSHGSKANSLVTNTHGRLQWPTWLRGAGSTWSTVLVSLRVVLGKQFVSSNSSQTRCCQVPSFFHLYGPSLYQKVPDLIGH